MDPLGIQKTEQNAATDLNALLTRIEALESKGAADVKAIASQVTADLKPMFQQAVDAVNNLTATAGDCIKQVTAVAQRIDGARLQATLTLGPEVAYPAPDVTVTG